ncbi:MAG TPA: hypothetical protein VKO16_00865 [Polyangia bacterium]|nr:hypothetical protein [Polyangia bacterium]
MTWLIAHAKYAAQVLREERLSGLPIIVRPFTSGTSPDGQSDLQRSSAQLGARRWQSRNRGRGGLRHRRITLGEIVRKQHGVGVGVSLDDATPDEESHHAGADDWQQIRDGRSPVIASRELLIHAHQVPMNAPAGDHDGLRSSALPVVSVRRAPDDE